MNACTICYARHWGACIPGCAYRPAAGNGRSDSSSSRPTRPGYNANGMRQCGADTVAVLNAALRELARRADR